MNRKIIIAFFMVIMLATVLILTSCAISPTGEVVAKEELTKVSVRLPISFINVAFAPFYSAIDNGYYEEEGLEVTYNLGSAELNPPKMVASGVDEFGYVGGPDTVLVARSRGQPLVAIGILHKDADFPILLTRKDSGLETVYDLEGKKIGFFYGHISTDVIHNLLNKYDINYEEIDVGMNWNQLISGKIDAQWGWRINVPTDLMDVGVETNIISPKDYGINVQGYTLFVTEETLNDNPEIIEKYLRATAKGIKFTKENPKQALQSILNRNENLNAEQEYNELLEYNRLSNGVNGFPYWYMTDEMFRETYDRLSEENVLIKEYDVKDAFTTRFISN